MQRIRYSRYLKTTIIILDIFIVGSVFMFFFLKKHSYEIVKAETEQNILSFFLLTFFWLLLSGRTKLYSIPRNLTYTLYVERIVTHFFLFFVGIILFAKASNNHFLQFEIFWIGIAIFTILFIIKSLIFFSLKFFRVKGGNFRNVMFLGDNDSSFILKNIITNRKDYGYKLFDFQQNNIDINQLKDFWKKNGIHTVFLPADNNLDNNLEKEIIIEAENNKVKIALIPSIVRNEFFEYDLGYIETQPILFPSKFPLSYYSNASIKRAFDVFFSILALILIGSWLFPIIAILIKLDSKGNVFFIQKRYGFYDEVFNCIKFRTMVENKDCAIKTTSENDVRITKIGKLLRKTSLDEMPQFFNVLLGQMSVVGPRPHMLLIDDYYKERIGRYAIRSLVKPGITGLAQVNGLRGDTGDMDVEMRKRILSDSFYVKNWSLTLDFIIILKTVFLLIKGDKKAI